jgi:site-specific recombinase XerC
MSIKHQLQQSIYHVLKHNRDGSRETQAARKHILYQMAKELSASQYKLKNMQGFKQKHVRYLHDQWNRRNLSNATIKNRNAHLRWLCEKLGKSSAIPSNDALGVGQRRYVNNHINKALHLNQIDRTKITHPHIWVQIHLQYHFGLRREESSKFKPHQADKGDYVQLQSSWCKGGRARQVPVLTSEARYWLNEAKKLISNTNDSLIPTDKTYIQHRHLYDKQMQLASIKHPHGFRHAFAQVHYKALTGWECPKKGGPTHKQLTREQKRKDKIARATITELLGHSRLQITVNYLGR